MHNSLRSFAVGSVIPRAGCLEQVTCCCDLCAKVCIIIINFIIIVIVSIFVEIFCVVCANEKTPKCIAWQLVSMFVAHFRSRFILKISIKFHLYQMSAAFDSIVNLWCERRSHKVKSLKFIFFNVLFLLNTLYLDNSWTFSCSDPTCR